MRGIPASRGRCKACGYTIWWAKKPGGQGFHRPLDEVDTSVLGLIVVDQDGTARMLDRQVYRPHVCNADAVAAHEKERQEFEDAHVDGTWHTHEHVSVVCPRCDAQVGERCRALDPKYAAKNGTHLRSAHEARVKLSESP